MIKFSKFGLLAVAAVFALALVACGKADKEKEVQAILDFVPADTPYVFAGLEPAPEDLIDKLEPQVDAMMSAYSKVIDSALEAEMAKLPDDSSDRAELENARGAVGELMSLMTIDGLRDAGIERGAKFVLYGNGVIPVARVELTDPALFDAAIDRVEEKAGKAMLQGEIDGETYRYVDIDKVKIVLGAIGDYGVATALPASFDDAQLRVILGLEKPGKTMADSGELAAVAKEFGFTDHMVGLVDMQRIVAVFIDPPTSLNADLLALAEYDSSDLDDVCREEIRELAGIAPRMVVGYTKLDAESLDSTMIVELRDDLASGLATIPASVPGLGTSQGGLFSFGMGFDLQAARSFYEARLDAMEESPFLCDKFADLQAGVAKGREALNQPVPPIVYGIRGFTAVVDGIEGLDLESKQPPESIDASFVLAVEGAPQLLSLGAMFSPEIAALNLQPDGEAVQFTPRQLGDQVDNLWLALSDDGLAMAIGDAAEKEAGAVLKAASATPAPFMSMSFDAGKYYSLIGDALMVEGDNEDEELPPEAREALRDMMQQVGDIYDRADVRVRFTDRGIEIASELTLGD